MLVKVSILILAVQAFPLDVPGQCIIMVANTPEVKPSVNFDCQYDQR